MSSFFSFLTRGNIKNALQKGAIVIDVRSAQEFDLGRVPESINIPVDRIAVNAERIRNMKRPVVFCCNSGHRSAEAVRIMKEKGLKEVYNGGSWESVLKKLNSI
jgi:rhodanese-related sulfurtransferase